MSGLLFTYPVHQAADILFCQRQPRAGRQGPAAARRAHAADRPPLQRALRRRRTVFPEPEALLSAAPVLLGTDGTKMSKSRGNTIELRDDEDRTAALLRSARTDSDAHDHLRPRPRARRWPACCCIAALCTGRDPAEIAADIGDRGAAALKAVVTEAVNEHLRPLRRRRRELAADPTIVRRVLDEGNARANRIADRTLDAGPRRDEHGVLSDQAGGRPIASERIAARTASSARRPPPPRAPRATRRQHRAERGRGIRQPRGQQRRDRVGPAVGMRLGQHAREARARDVVVRGDQRVGRPAPTASAPSSRSSTRRSTSSRTNAYRPSLLSKWWYSGPVVVSAARARSATDTAA